MRSVRALAGFLLVLTATVAAAGATSAAAAQPHVSVFFLRGEQLAHVTRPGTTALDAVRQLLAGPTRAEVALGFRTYVPTNTRVLSVKVANGIATVDLNERFASGRDAASLLARLSQLVRTLTGPQGATKVQLLMNGGVVAARFPGMSLSRPITFHFLQTPNVPVPKPPALKLPAPDAAVKTLQLRLIDLGYMVKGDADGRFGPATQNAILSFQKWEKLGRTGLLGRRHEGEARDRDAPGSAHARRERQAGRGPARPSSRAADRRRQGRADDRGLDRQAVDADAAGRLPRLREDSPLVVDPVPRVAPVGASVRGGHRLPRAR